jgi:hypothetical protein
MFRRLWKTINRKFKKYTKKDNLNTTHLNDTPSDNWDLNFTKIAVVWAETR